MRKLIRYEPLESFPQARTTSPKRSPFSAPWNRTEQQLLDEASKLLDDGYWHEVVIALDADPGDFRVDGAGLLANAQLRSQAVVVYVGAADVSFPCDAFLSWRDNVRAVALTMEKLRAIARYGVADRGQQYTGWKALPAATAMPAAPDPVGVLMEVLGWSREQVEADTKGAVAKARKSTHPDTGVVVGMFDQVQAAARSLKVPS